MEIRKMLNVIKLVNSLLEAILHWLSSETESMNHSYIIFFIEISPSLTNMYSTD